MNRRESFPHGADLSVYPTVAAMIEAHIAGYYRTYPHEAWMRIGPLPELPAGANEYERIALAESRPRAHAIIVLPRRIVAIRCARRATARDCERLAYERTLIASTPELAAVRHWRIEARLVYCDIAAGVEAAASEYDIRPHLYRPRWLHTHRPKAVADPRMGRVLRKLTALRLAQYADYHDPPMARIPDPAMRAWLQHHLSARLTPEQRSARNSQANRTRWARLTPEQRSEVNRQRGGAAAAVKSDAERSAWARRMNEIRWSREWWTPTAMRARRLIPTE